MVIKSSNGKGVLDGNHETNVIIADCVHSSAYELPCYGYDSGDVIEESGAEVILDGLVLQNGIAPTKGGCVSLGGAALIIQNSELRGCTAPPVCGE